MKIRVDFEVPDDIAFGLTNGTLERVGGVIRFADSKQVVAWLRDGGNISRSSSSGLTLLPTLLQATGMNARTVAVVAGAVTVAGPLLDVAITTYTIYRLTQRIQALKQEIADIYDRLDKLFAKDHAAALSTALILAESFLNTEDFDERQGMLANVIKGLVQAQQLLLLDIDDALSANRLNIAGKMIAAFQTLSTMESRCLLDFGSEKNGIARFKANAQALRPSVQRLVRRLVGDNSALFFHKSVSNDYLDRYIQIQAWLRGERDAWESVVKEARKDFWNGKAIKRLFRKHRKFLHVWHELREDPFYLEAVPRAEELIESFQRFESYALDLESSDRPSDNLERLSEDAVKRLAEHDDYVLIIDEDAIGRVQRLSA